MSIFETKTNKQPSQIVEVRPDLTNKGESKSFLRTALAIRGSVSPVVTRRVLLAASFSLACSFLFHHYPQVAIPITPFEYSGAVLSLFLLLRINSGLDRWWEARKIWGSIVNQSRNLAIIGYEYSTANQVLSKSFLSWVAAWPHVMKESLRGEKSLIEVEELLGKEETQKIRVSQHMPTYVGAKIAELIGMLRSRGLDNFAFQRAEKERALLIDAIGASERIRNTPIPLAIAIIVRRFILLFLLLLPLGLVDRVVWLTPLVVALAAYPLFALDEIGAELQNPFSPRNISHLPLKSLCVNIQANVLSLLDKPRGNEVGPIEELPTETEEMEQ